MITLVIGGEKSGKSRFALEEARKQTGRKAFVATSERIDEEMGSRIETHRRERGEEFQTFEEPIAVSKLLLRLADQFEVIVIDCLTVWLSNLMHYGIDETREIERLLQVLSSQTGHVILVSNEVGLGIIPATELGRKFTQTLGILNRMVAEQADRVVFMIAGIPLEIKKEDR